MGLAAGQARLLTITARKSDCEFQSMTLSHQKIALSRELADISNEYQNSLTKTKLFYDYYGTGDQTSQLNYMTHLMSPSVLNDYMPTLITDTSGRAVLNSKYAAAARRAGIPQEGLGTLPSEAMRNLFVEGLQESGLITTQLKDKIQGLPYNQQAGFGGGAVVVANYAEGDFTKFLDFITNSSNQFDSSDTKTRYSVKKTNCKKDSTTAFINVVKNDCSATSKDSSNISQLSLAELLGGSDQYYLAYGGIKGEQSPVFGVALMQNFLTDPNGFIDWLYDEFSTLLDLGDGVTGTALNYAYEKTIDLLTTEDKTNLDTSKYSSWGDFWLAGYDGGKNLDDDSSWKKDGKDNEHRVRGYLSSIATSLGTGSEDEHYQNWVVENSKDYIGFTMINGHKGGGDDGNDHATAGLNLNNVAKVFLTYFEDYVNGIAKTDVYGRDYLSVNKGGIGGSELVTKKDDYVYKWKSGTDISSDDLAYATFYDALFNQICAHGWMEESNIDDSSFLQDMLQSGKMFLSKPKDDHYYYQQNYATDTYIKEIADESFIAQAEAKYATEKAKLNSKEETIDLKMKNLDTEISSLTTEYDTVKNTISKNIEKSFKRYNA